MDAAAAKHEEWKQDAAAADPTVLPEYTALPSSPSPASPLLGRAPAPAASDFVPSTTLANPSPQSASDSDADSNSESGRRPRSEGRRILRMIMRGVTAIVLPPFIMAGAGLAASLAIIYGVGKMLEGIGRALAAGPEALYKVCAGRKTRAAWRAVRGKKARAPDAETGAISI